MFASGDLLLIWTEVSLARKTHGLFSSCTEFGGLQKTCTKSDTDRGKYFQIDQT